MGTELEINAVKPINVILKFFRICALWPAKSKYRWIYILYSIIFHSIFTVAYISLKLANLFIETDLNLLTIGFSIFLAEVSLVGRIINLFVNFDDIILCLNLVKGLQLSDENEHRIVKKNLSFFSDIMRFCISFSTCACLVSWGAPLFASETKLPYPGWYPIDWKGNRKDYWTVFWYQVISVAFEAHAIILLQLFSIYWMMIVGAHFDVLNYRLENMGKFGKTAVETEQEFVECVKFHLDIIR